MVLSITSTTQRRHHRPQNDPPLRAFASVGPTAWILLCFFLSVTSFHLGMLVAMNMQQNFDTKSIISSMIKTSSHGTTTEDCNTLKDDHPPENGGNKNPLQVPASGTSSASSSRRQVSSITTSSSASSSSHSLPKKETSRLVSGIGLVDRDAFAERFDMGVPLDATVKGNERVLLLYSNELSFPNSMQTKKTSGDDADTATSDDGPIRYIGSVEEATENCDSVHVVLSSVRPHDKQCVAIMGQYQSFHIQNFMRLPTEEARAENPDKKAVDSNLPLRLVSRGMQLNGRISTKTPTQEMTLAHWKNLVPYIDSLETVLLELDPIAKAVASHNENNAVIVMVCNFGQSELLMNFVCNAHRKGLSEYLANILVFCTDEDTCQLAQSIGLTTFFDEKNFGRMPVKAARAYADKTFMDMMAAKVYCVQMVSMLGYDILFQDVDVVWYKNPLPWFHDQNNPNYHFDMYFQDDGNHDLYYAPYAANTGFYYVRNNVRTKYFFNSLLMAGDLILSSKSHQIALIALLNEHTSMYGLKVKVWERNLEEFPGGYSFHQKRPFMKKVVQGLATPYIFHMSWTYNKSNKFKFFQQMGEWFLKDTCNGQPVKKIKGGVTVDNCCFTEPDVKCHYRDKPSKIPCKEFDPIDAGGRSFW